MDSSNFAAIIEAVAKIINPKLENELARGRIEQDKAMLGELVACGYRPECIEYVNGRLRFKVCFPENPNAQIVDVPPLNDLKDAAFGNTLLSGDDGKLQLEPQQKKYE